MIYYHQLKIRNHASALNKYRYQDYTFHSVSDAMNQLKEDILERDSYVEYNYDWDSIKDYLLGDKMIWKWEWKKKGNCDLYLISERNNIDSIEMINRLECVSNNMDWPTDIDDFDDKL